MLQWRIYYDGGLTFDNLMGLPSQAPAFGVVSIIQRNDCFHHPTEWLKPEINLDTNRPIEMLEGADWYWWREDKQRWFRGDLMGLLDQAMNCPDFRSVKQGRYLTHEEWEKLLLVISNDQLD